MEALAIVLVSVVVLGLYAGARFGAGAHAAGPEEELAGLREYRRLLEQKIRRGQAERWDAVMMRQLTDKRDETDRRIAARSGPA